MSPRVILAGVLALSSLVACKVIGPSVASEPGPGKTQAAYEQDRRGCMGEVDRRLQPIADRANTLATPLSVVAANNQQLQIAYDRGYADCMVARGESVATPAVAAVVVPRPAAVPPAAVAVAGGGPARDLLPDGWRLMRFAYHAASGKPRDENDALWSREIANPPAGPGAAMPIYTLRFEDGARSVLVSVAGQGEPTCDNGPNGARVTRDYAVCPGKLALVENGRVLAVRTAGMLCTEAIKDGVAPGAPGWQDPTRWGTRGRYDPAAGTIDLVTMQDGHPQPGCTKQLRVR